MSSNNTATTNKDEDLVEWIREWIQLDADYKSLMVQLAGIKRRKKELTGYIVKAMQDKSQDGIKTRAGGSLVRKQKRNKASISAKYLKEQLDTYFQSSGGGQSDELFARIDAGRAVKIVDEIEYHA
jgi:hypothetical protein